jgi:hypothetical protein
MEGAVQDISVRRPLCEAPGEPFGLSNQVNSVRDVEVNLWVIGCS